MNTKNKNIKMSVSKKKKEDKPLVWEEYVKYQKEFEEKYKGNKVIVIIQVGDFYEMYSQNNKEGYLYEVSKILGLRLAKKDMRGDPYMAGVPMHAIRRFLDILFEHEYTVIFVEQNEKPNIDGKFDRSVTKICSKAINFMVGNMENSNIVKDENNLMSMYVEENTNMQGKVILSIGLSVIDISIGRNTIYEINGVKEEQLFEEIYRFVESFNVCEIVINVRDLKQTSKEEFMKLLEVDGRTIHYNKVDARFLKVSYQDELLKRIFPKCGLMDPAQYLHMEYKPYALHSYVLLLQFTYQHMPVIIENIQYPKIYENSGNLVLYNNALYQLDVINSNVNKNKVRNSSKINCLFDVINKTSTSIGKRYLKNKMLNPITNVDELNSRYDKIEEMRPNVEEYRLELRKIIDVERYHRKLGLLMLKPNEYAFLDESYNGIMKILEMEENILFEKFVEYVNKYRYYFDVEKMLNSEGNVICYFNNGIFKELDELQEIMDNREEFFEKERDKLDLLVRKQDKGKSDKQTVSFKYYEEKKAKSEKKVGSYILYLTDRRAGLLKQAIKNSDMEGKYKFESYVGDKKRIISEEIIKNSYKMVYTRDKLRDMLSQKYNEVCSLLNKEYKELLDNIAKIVGEVDMVNSLTRIAIKYGYQRPLLVDNFEGRSYVDIKDMRHPIAERLPMNVNYVRNDVKLGGDGVNGMLLYGVNRSGKTVFAKGVALNIIMAQMGGYVAASSMKYYPYERIFARITGEDDMMRGYSSFEVEMMELRAILRMSNERSLIIGDEICRGTETVSGMGIVAAGVRRLCKGNKNFIFATHLHSLVELEEIKELNNLGVYHLKVRREGDKLIYDRRLEEGSGDSRYGLEVARFLLKDKEFIKDAQDISNKVVNRSEYILNPESSKYNKDSFRHDCRICGKTYKEEQIDDHHIIHQAECKMNVGELADGYVDKDAKSNRVFLCKTHHVEVHNGKLEIRGYVETSEGVELDYGYVERKKSKLKYGKEDVEKIKKICGDVESMRGKIKKLEKEGIKIGMTTLKKILEGNYNS